MDQLWSPWRSEYIGTADERNEQGCFLCRCAEATEISLASLVVARFEHCFVVMNRFPYNAGHLLVAPNVHHADLATLDPAIAASMMSVLQTAVRVTQHVLAPHGINVGANLGRHAGAGVPDHLHLHTVPRWNGDTNFMPVLADVKVVSEDLPSTWARFAKAFAELAKT
ncbi:MAG: HIT domain-containing protein [Bacteroidetes bacterium]|nr:HIT domain-containing protein [Bacteroidota bacterium]